MPVVPRPGGADAEGAATYEFSQETTEGKHVTHQSLDSVSRVPGWKDLLLDPGLGL